MTAVPFVYYSEEEKCTIFLEIDHVERFPRDSDGNCCFCLGDPVGARSLLDSHIMTYFHRVWDADVCPFCKGRA